MKKNEVLSLRSTTKIFGCIADPIDHVKAPTLFSSVFARNNIDAVMIPLNVEDKNLGVLIDGLKNLKNFLGLTVTIPHKVNILNFCDDLDIEASQTGAVNWIKFENGKVLGRNFDGVGFVQGLKSKNITLANKSVCLFGAGGAGMAISFALLKNNIKKLKVVNRNPKKLKNLIDRLKKYFPDTLIESDNFFNYKISDCDIIINATSLGLKNNIELPFDVKKTKRNSLIAEIIMEPEETELIKEAKKNKNQVILGRLMLESQIDLAARFFNLW